MPVKKRFAKGRLLVFTSEQRAWYAALQEPTFEKHREFGLKLWHDWVRPGYATLEEAVEAASED
ncbi:hypothetical protein JQ620_15760 [Bradyrhizobium sp. AUGA SZCCT0274]|uniref:hypothetical protein n=1 Tax=Bradyrhizobium sp. AUGA SZCCT0274 TaxID=2807670 RepID=UPI001BA51E4C|nr:hypothetical protein [Bradyrhizobium sp. AUGA SZCCT0274]MBR1241585.1 hypothetical protein [Bradyrhizobium sp. AUGA SZCCT0274]